MEETVAVLALFLLRIAVPLLVTLAIAYALRRLDVKWQTEAQTQWTAAELSAEQIAELKALKPERPCWEVKGCSEEMRAKCPACGPLDIPCWVARLRASGHLPSTCPNCEMFAPVLAR
jgi:hypothetical protein